LDIDERLEKLNRKLNFLPLMDPTLDIYSPSFDAAKALYSSDFKPPKEVQPLDYVAKCRVLLPTWDTEYLKPLKPKEKSKDTPGNGMHSSILKLIHFEPKWKIYFRSVSSFVSGVLKLCYFIVSNTEKSQEISASEALEKAAEARRKEQTAPRPHLFDQIAGMKILSLYINSHICINPHGPYVPPQQRSL
jgi:hypothetical protein